MDKIISDLENIENRSVIYYDNETMSLIIRRWRRLRKIFYNEDTDRYVMSKVLSF